MEIIKLTCSIVFIICAVSNIVIMLLDKEPFVIWIWPINAILWCLVANLY